MVFGDGEADSAMVDIYREYLDDGEASLARLQEMSPDSERPAIAKEAHKLKGSASNFGFARMAELLAEMENDIEALSAVDCEKLLGEAAAAFAYARRQVAERFPEVQG